MTILKRFWWVLIVVGVLAGGYYFLRGNGAELSGPQFLDNLEIVGRKKPTLVGSKDAATKLTFGVHWENDYQREGVFRDGKLVSKGLIQYLEEYIQANPDIAFEVQVIPYGEYEESIRAYHVSGDSPDIIQIYSNWGVSYVDQGILAEPPEDIVADVRRNYVSTAGVEIEGKIWGYPTEVNTFSLLYNKDIFKQAGIEQPPRTFAEMVEMAKKTTRRDSSGKIEQYGIAFLVDNDWQVVDPFLSFLFSNYGQYLSSDNTRAMLAQPQAIEVLKAQVGLFEDGATDLEANFFDFSEGKVAMVISPPWTRAIMEEGFGENFESKVGIAPLPYFKKPATLQYSWFAAVPSRSFYKAEAWDFLRWFTATQEETNTSRYGDLLAETIGAIPSKKVDLANHDILDGFFMKTFVDQIGVSVAEPNVLNSAQIKNVLMEKIQAAWGGSKTSEIALREAANEIDLILQSN